MKMLIQKQINLIHCYAAGSENFEEEAYEIYESFVDNELAILDRFNVQYAFVNNYMHCSLTLYEQKIVLDEYNMNILFFDVLDSFDTNYNIRYLPIGGAGCELCIELTANE
jgi:hypothetical protein